MDRVFLMLYFNSQLAPLTHPTFILELLSSFSWFKVPFKSGLLIQPTSSLIRHYKRVISLYFLRVLCIYQYNADTQIPALAISAFGSANAGTVSLPNTLFTAGIDDNILAKSFKTDIATIQALQAGLAPKPWGWHSLWITTLWYR